MQINAVYDATMKYGDDDETSVRSIRDDPTRAKGKQSESLVRNMLERTINHLPWPFQVDSGPASLFRVSSFPSPRPARDLSSAASSSNLPSPKTRQIVHQIQFDLIE